MRNRQQNSLVLVSRAAADGVLGSRSVAFGPLAASAMPGAATAASVAAAAHHQDYDYAEYQPEPVLRQPFHDFS